MRRQKAQNRIRPWAVALWLVVWELASLYIGQEILLVSPVSVLRRLCDLALRPDFWSSIAFSFFRIIGGFLHPAGRPGGRLLLSEGFARARHGRRQGGARCLLYHTDTHMGAFPEPVHCHFLPYGPSGHLYECTQRYPQHRSQASGNGQGFPDTSVPPHTLYLSFPATSLPADRLLPFPGTVLESGRCRRGNRYPQRLYR